MSDSPSTTDPSIIKLSRYRARLGRTPRGNRYEQLMSSDQPEQGIAELSGDEIYSILRENDFREAADLLRYATVEQVQVVADFSLWTTDRPTPARLAEWVEMMAELPSESVGRWFRGLDIELIALLIRKGARIYDLGEQEPPEESEGLFYPTPDRLFVLDVLGYGEIPVASEETGHEVHVSEGSETAARALIHVLDNLYRDDLNLARRILVGAKAEMDSELEETAFRWRQGRMADRGFIDFTEALEIYRELDPASVRIGEKGLDVRAQPIDPDGSPAWRAPEALAAQMSQPSSLFVSALEQITQPNEVDELHFALVTLSNRVLSADRVDVSDESAAAKSLERMRMTLDIAVEFLAREAQGGVDPLRVVEAVRTVPLIRLFRLGVSLIGKVQRLARTWTRKGPFATLPHLDLVEDPEATVLESLLHLRPSYARLLDAPPAAGERPFGSLADIARATAAVQRIAAAQAALIGLGIRPEHLRPEALAQTSPSDVAAIDAGLLARTALILLLLSDDAPESEKVPSAFHALSNEELARFETLVSDATADGPIPIRAPREIASSAVLKRARELLQRAVPEGLAAAAEGFTTRWVASLAPLQPVLRQATPLGSSPHV